MSEFALHAAYPAMMATRSWSFGRKETSAVIVEIPSSGCSSVSFSPVRKLKTLKMHTITTSTVYSAHASHLDPDSDLEKEVEVIQCCLCEEWFHEEHLGLDPSQEIPLYEEGEPLYTDFICKSCSAHCSFLSLYPPTIHSSKKESALIPGSSDGKAVVDETETPPACGSSRIENGNLSNDSALTSNNNPSEEKGSSSVGETAATIPHCVLETADQSVVRESRPLFLSDNLRDILCRCEKCVDMYEQKRIGFLLDKEDTMAEYWKMGMDKREERLQQQKGVELNILNNLGHVLKIDILITIADMEDELHMFLQSYDASKPITSDVSTKSLRTLLRSGGMISGIVLLDFVMFLTF